MPHCLVDYYAGSGTAGGSHTPRTSTSTPSESAAASRTAPAGRARSAAPRLRSLGLPRPLADVRDHRDRAATGRRVRRQRLFPHRRPIARPRSSSLCRPTRSPTPRSSPGYCAEHGRTLVHSHFAYPAAEPARLAGRALRRRASRSPSPFTPSTSSMRANRERNQLAEMAADELCARVFAIGEFHRSFLIDRASRRSKISIARPAARAALRARRGSSQARLGRERRVVGAITRFVAKKGLDDLIRAARRSAPESRFACTDTDPARPSCASSYSELGASNIRLHGAPGARRDWRRRWRGSTSSSCPAWSTSTATWMGCRR